MPALANDRADQRFVERVLVCVGLGAHGLDERLARERAVVEEVLRIVCDEDPLLFVSCNVGAVPVSDSGKRGEDSGTEGNCVTH